MKKPLVCVLRTDGINCDEETFYAFESEQTAVWFT